MADAGWKSALLPWPPNRPREIGMGELPRLKLCLLAQCAAGLFRILLGYLFTLNDFGYNGLTDVIWGTVGGLFALVDPIDLNRPIYLGFYAAFTGMNGVVMELICLVQNVLFCLD